MVLDCWHLWVGVEDEASCVNSVDQTCHLSAVFSSRSQFLDLGTVDILGWVTPCCPQGLPRHCINRMFNSIPGLYPLSATGTPSCDNQSYLQIWPSVPGGMCGMWKLLSRVRLFATPWNSLGQNTGVGSLSLLQGIFPTQGPNPGLPHCRQILYSWATREAQVQEEENYASPFLLRTIDLDALRKRVKLGIFWNKKRVGKK